MSDWFIQQSGFSSDKVLGPLTSEQVVALFVRGEINKKTPLASQKHTSNDWVLIKDSVLWSAVQEALQKEKEEKSRQEEALKQQKEETKRQQEQDRKEAENKQQQQRQEQQQQQQQQLAMQQAAQAQAAAQQQVVPVPTDHRQGGRLVTNIAAGEITAVQLAGSIIVVVGALSVVGGVLGFLGSFVGILTSSSGAAQAAAISVMGMAVAAILYGLLMVGVGAAMKIFGRMGQLLEQNTLAVLTILERS